MPTAILFYDVVLWVHVTAIVLAFGGTFAYPIVDATLRHSNPAALPSWWEAQDRLGKVLVTPAATVALLAGAYLATDRDLWAEVWVTVPLVILIVLLGMGGAFFAPLGRKLAASGARDVAAAGGGEVRFSPETEALYKRVAMGGTVAGLLILVALFFMIVKPGA